MKKENITSTENTTALNVDLVEKSDQIAAVLTDIQTRLSKIESIASTENQNNTSERVVYSNAAVYEKDCCCYEIILYKARVIKDQGGALSTEPTDGGIGSEQMELIFGVTADGFNGVYPGLTSHVTMSEKSGWHIFNQKIALVSGNQSIPVSASAREVEVSTNPLVIPLEGRAEFGTSDTAYMNLKCDCPVLPIQFDISLTGGSVNKRGLVMVEIIAKKVCCPC